VLAQVGLAEHASILASHLPDGLARRLPTWFAILPLPATLETVVHFIPTYYLLDFIAQSQVSVI
jgi:hypothetical protein